MIEVTFNLEHLVVALWLVGFVFLCAGFLYAGFRGIVQGKTALKAVLAAIFWPIALPALCAKILIDISNETT